MKRSSLCQLCELYAEETIPHFLLQCKRLHEPRATLMADLLSVMPPAMVNDFSHMPHCKQAEFLLGELGQTNVIEWKMVHTKIIDLVYQLWKKRDNMLKLL